MKIDLNGKVALVTGAGGGLGRAHALLLARRGAKVIVNDFDAPGAPSSRAAEVVKEITAGGGEAMANGASVTDMPAVEAMVQAALKRFGRIDILVANAGILKDKSFAKMTLEDFRSVLDVHLMGSVHCAKAVWETMRTQNQGRIVLTTSSTGLYGNFGQSNYGAAKMALVGLMQTLALEGAKYDIRVNCLAPTAATRMTEGVLTEEQLKRLAPEHVSPGLLALVGPDAPTRTILCAGAGSYEQAHITLTRGIFVGDGPDAPEQVAARLKEIGDRTQEIVPGQGWDQVRVELEKGR